MGDEMKVLHARVGDAALAADRGNLARRRVDPRQRCRGSSSRGFNDVHAIALHDRAYVANARGQYELGVRYAFDALLRVRSLTARDRILVDLALSFAQMGVLGAARDAFLVVVEHCAGAVRALAGRDQPDGNWDASPERAALRAIPPGAGRRDPAPVPPRAVPLPLRPGLPHLRQRRGRRAQLRGRTSSWPSSMGTISCCSRSRHWQTSSTAASSRCPPRRATRQRNCETSPRQSRRCVSSSASNRHGVRTPAARHVGSGPERPRDSHESSARRCPCRLSTFDSSAFLLSTPNAKRARSC